MFPSVTELLAACTVGTAVVAACQLIRLLVSDCDLTLQWVKWFGKSPAALRGKVVWITGASSGIGEHLAYELAKNGCRLILSARREHLLNKVKNKCLEVGPLTKEDVLILPLDVLSFETHSAAVETVVKYFKKIDVLINNAGRSMRALFSDTSLEVDRQMLELNTLAPVSLTKAILPHFKENGGGHIVVVSSLLGIMGVPGQAAYSGSKHALQGWFNAFRIECLEDDITVTLCCPGPVQTENLSKAFTGVPGQVLDGEVKDDNHRMTPSRCAYLAVVGIANQLPEFWISLQPELIFCYMAQYCPVIFKRVAKKPGAALIRNMKKGIYVLNE